MTFLYFASLSTPSSSINYPPAAVVSPRYLSSYHRLHLPNGGPVRTCGRNMGEAPYIAGSRTDVTRVQPYSLVATLPHPLLPAISNTWVDRVGCFRFRLLIASNCVELIDGTYGDTRTLVTNANSTLFPRFRYYFCNNSGAIK
jgi:hypothetical protein